jgi:hypothetical protein
VEETKAQKISYLSKTKSATSNNHHSYSKEYNASINIITWIMSGKHPSEWRGSLDDNITRGSEGQLGFANIKFLFYGMEFHQS